MSDSNDGMSEIIVVFCVALFALIPFFLVLYWCYGSGEEEKEGGTFKV